MSMNISGLEVHEAASVGDYDTLEQHLQSGKYDPNMKDPDWSDKTPLHWAAQKGYTECIRLLLDYGADGTSRQSMRWTPAHCAAEAGKVHALRALHTHGVPVNKADKYGDTPRRVAEIYGHTECVNFLDSVARLSVLSSFSTKRRSHSRQSSARQSQSSRQSQSPDQDSNYSTIYSEDEDGATESEDEIFEEWEANSDNQNTNSSTGKKR